MKELGRMNTDKIEKIRTLVSIIDELDREVISELRSLAGDFRYYIEDRVEPYRTEDEYIFELLVFGLDKDTKWLVVKRDGVVMLLDKRERWAKLGV